MATIACPGCGMPRNESEIEKPCPVCASAQGMASVPAPRAKKQAESTPTDGLPSDATELAARPPEGGSPVLVGTVTFVFGVLCGVGGLLAFQELTKPKPNSDEPEVVEKKPEVSEPPAKPQAPQKPAIAPMPHEPAPPPIVIAPDDPDFKIITPPLPGHLTTVQLNLPESDYHVPFPMKKGEHVVLKGRVRKFHVTVLDGGSILDASELEAAIITVSGKIDGGSTLKLRAPNGVVQISGHVDGKSQVNIDAPGGEVRFLLATTQRREGSKIDNGSTVTVTARRAEFKGDIAGTGTRVTVALTRGGSLDMEAVRGEAVVEYKSQPADLPAPTVSVKFTASTAVVRKVE